MVVVLGASGYIGRAFVRELRRRGRAFTPLSRRELDYTRFEPLLHFLRLTRPEFLINAAGFAGRPNVDACETARAETLAGNTLLPQTIAHACAATSTPWGHVSSGCIYSGAWFNQAGKPRLEPDLNQPRVRQFIAAQPEQIRGFAETDEPNFTFRRPPCSFYSGSKALAEECLAGRDQVYLWRMRIPFDEEDHPKNYLTKLLRYERIYDTVNSLSHRGEFVRACLDLRDRGAPPGVYNLTNPGFTTTRRAVELIEKVLRPGRRFEFFAGDEDFYRTAARAPRSNCVLDVSKALTAGAALRPVEEALLDALTRWEPAPA